MIDSDDGAGRYRREVSAAVVNGRLARELVAPVLDKLGAWQAESVKLGVMVQRMRQVGRHDAGLAEAVHTLLGVVERQARAFAQEAAAAPPAVGQHSRVLDTHKVLALLVARLEKLRNELGQGRAR